MRRIELDVRWSAPALKSMLGSLMDPPFACATCCKSLLFPDKAIEQIPKYPLANVHYD